MREHIGYTQSIDSQIVDDIVETMVKQEGAPDTDETRAIAMTRLLLARLKVKSKAMLNPPKEDEQDRLYQKYMLVPSRTSFWIHTLLFTDSDRIGQIRYINHRRERYMRDTSLDCAT